jgi:hypothetical protein
MVIQRVRQVLTHPLPLCWDTVWPREHVLNEENTYPGTKDMCYHRCVWPFVQKTEYDDVMWYIVVVISE